MDEKRHEKVPSDYGRYVVDQYIPRKDPREDAAEEVVSEFPSERPVHGNAIGSKEHLFAWFNLEDGEFVVYLPPENPDWGNSGFSPSQEVAVEEFKYWLGWVEKMWMSKK